MENYIDPKKVYVLNKNEVLLAVFDKDDEEPIINPQVEKTQNAEAVFTFSISINNPKWTQINNPENLYVVDGKVYSANFEGCFTEIVSENNENLVQVKAYERQKLLSRKLVTAWNSETGFESIDDFMVVVLSNGNLPLKNGGTTVSTSHTIGTSGYVLDALLYGTGWTTGTCDVEGTFDFETEQLDVYENILKVQEIWGGILVFDSINKTVSHRDETVWLPYNGYEVKYQKNMQSLEKLYNNKIITKLCPLGEGALNIASVNNGSIWLTNYTYTDTVSEGIENNPDIYDAAQLKRWGQRKLQDLCKPRTELTVKAALLYQVEGYELETVDLNDIVDVINFGPNGNDVVQLRVVGFTYKIWDYSDATLELSDITLDSTDIFKKNVQATNQINAGTLDTTQVVSFFRAGQTVEKSLRDVDNAVAELVINEDSIVSTVKNGGLNLLLDTNNTEWKEVSCNQYAARSASLRTNTAISDLGLAVGDKITYSLYIKSTSGKKLRARITYLDSNSSTIKSAYAANDYIIQNGEGFSYVSSTIPANCVYIALYVDANLTATTVTQTTTEYVKAEKFEKSTFPTTWTPSIEDYSTTTQVIQTAESITSTATKELGISGRNLLKGTTTDEIEISTSFYDKFLLTDYAKDKIESTDKLTLSFDAKASDSTIYTDFYFRSASTSYNNADYFYPSFHLTTSYVHYTFTGLSGLNLADKVLLRQRKNTSEHGGGTITGKIYIKNLKLEKGNEETPWSPANEDMATISTNIAQTASQISLTASENQDGQVGLTIKLKNSDGTELQNGQANITLTGLVSFTNLSTSNPTTTIINGDNITTGAIASANYAESSGSTTAGTKINLTDGTIKTKYFKVASDGKITSTGGTIGGFTLGTNTFSANLTSQKMATYTYTNSDETRLQNILLGNITPTTSDYDKYDFDYSGNFTSRDYLILHKIILGTETGKATFSINTKYSEKALSIKNSSGKEVVNLGLFGSYINHLSYGNLDGGAITSDNAFIIEKKGVRRIEIISGNDTQADIYLSNTSGTTKISLEGQTGAITCVSLTQTSLAESKKNFIKLENALDIIKNIDIYKYNFKEEEDTFKKHIGFVIGDKYKYSQEITSNENDGVDIYSFVSVCCKAIQELQAEIEELKNSKK